jgi:hypothetical protein
MHANDLIGIQFILCREKRYVLVFLTHTAHSIRLYPCQQFNKFTNMGGHWAMGIDIAKPPYLSYDYVGNKVV